MSLTAINIPHGELVITTGEPAGIGPEITIQALLHAQFPAATRIAVLGDPHLLEKRAALIGQELPWQHLLEQGHIRLIPCKLAQACQAGVPDVANAHYVLSMLNMAAQACLSGDFGAMVTAPIQKSTIAATGIPFSGHTEYLAQISHTDIRDVVMMLMGPQMMRADQAVLRVALASIHLSLREVPDSLSSDGLVRTLRTIDHDLKRYFNLPHPRILVAGLNPHAGEGGLLGQEERDIIEPALKMAQAQGIHTIGPLPADTLFQPRHLDKADCVLAMYHDQGLAPLKYATFGHGSNVTLGLPFIRTSVDHGTALDLAGTGKASYTSMLAALNVALQMAHAKSRIQAV